MLLFYISCIFILLKGAIASTLHFFSADFLLGLLAVLFLIHTSNASLTHISILAKRVARLKLPLEVYRYDRVNGARLPLPFKQSFSLCFGSYRALVGTTEWPEVELQKPPRKLWEDNEVLNQRRGEKETQGD